MSLGFRVQGSGGGRGMPSGFAGGRLDNRDGYPTRSRAAMHGRGGHRGYALVEALVVISINSVLLAVALTLLGTLLKGERGGRRHYEQTRSIMRLASDLRRAAAVADAAESDPAQTKLRLRLPDQRAVEFTRDADRIRSVEREGSSIVRREAYPIVELSGARFHLAADQLISIELDVHGEADRPWHIDARLATEHRIGKEAAP